MIRSRTAFAPAILILALALMLSIPGCDDDDDDGLVGASGPVTVNAPAVASHDGTCSFSPTDSVSSGVLQPRAGDRPGLGTRHRLIFTFDISAIPPGATIESATMNVFQSAIVGDPYTLWAPDGLDFSSHIVLDTSAAFPAFACSIPGTRMFDAGGVDVVLSDNAVLEYKTLDVSERVAADLAAGRTSSSYRIGPAIINADAIADAAFFNDGEDNAGNGQLPFITIVYRN